MGFPNEAYKQEESRMSLDEFILGTLPPEESATYMMQVGNISMPEEGIFPGDYLIVERTATINPGQLIVVSENGEFHLQYLSVKSYTNEIRVEAVVRAVVRKY